LASERERERDWRESRRERGQLDNRERESPGNDNEEEETEQVALSFTSTHTHSECVKWGKKHTPQVSSSPRRRGVSSFLSSLPVCFLAAGCPCPLPLAPAHSLFLCNLHFNAGMTGRAGMGGADEHTCSPSRRNSTSWPQSEQRMTGRIWDRRGSLTLMEECFCGRVVDGVDDDDVLNKLRA